MPWVPWDSAPTAGRYFAHLQVCKCGAATDADGTAVPLARGGCDRCYTYPEVVNVQLRSELDLLDLLMVAGEENARHFLFP